MSLENKPSLEIRAKIERKTLRTEFFIEYTTNEGLSECAREKKLGLQFVKKSGNSVNQKWKKKIAGQGG